MDLKFINAESFDTNLKCSIHKNGKLGFSSSAINKLQIDNSKSVKFAQNEDEKENGNLYVVIQDNITDDAFKINKAGDYYYMNTKAMFDELGYDYRNTTIIFDIVKTETKHNELPVYKLIKREVKSRK